MDASEKVKQNFDLKDNNPLFFLWVKTMFRRKKTYLALYERQDKLGFHMIDFTTMKASKPPKPEQLILRTGFTGRIIIFEIKEVSLDGHIHNLPRIP